MSLGSFLGTAGLTIPAADAGYASGIAMVNANHEQAARNRASDAAARMAARNALAMEAAAAIAPNTPQGQPAPSPLALLDPPKAPAPPKPPAPAAGGETPPATTAAAPATPVTAVPSGSPLVGVRLPAQQGGGFTNLPPQQGGGFTNLPSGPPGTNRAALDTSIAVPGAPGAFVNYTNGQPGGYKPPPGAPGTAPLTPVEATQLNDWLVSRAGSIYLGQHPEEQRKMLYNPEKWARETFFAKGLSGIKYKPTDDPLSLVPGLQAKVKATSEEPGWLEKMTRGALSVEAGPMAAVKTNDPSNPNAKILHDLLTSQTMLGRQNGTVAKEVMARATMAAAPNVTTTPQQATDVVPTPTGPMTAGAAVEVAQNKPPTNWYQGAPETITPDMQRAIIMRKALVGNARDLAQVGTAEAAKAVGELIPKLGEIDTQIAYLQGMKAIQEATTMGDTRRMAQVMSYHTGVPINIQPVRDGTYNIIRGDTGKALAEGLSLEQLVDRGRSLVDSKYVIDRDAAEAARLAKRQEHLDNLETEGVKGQYQLGQQIVKDNASMRQALAVAQMDNDGKLNVEMFKAQHPELKVQPVGDENGTVIITMPTGELYRYNSVARQVTDGEGRTTTLPNMERIASVGGGAGLTTSGPFPAGAV